MKKEFVAYCDVCGKPTKMKVMIPFEDRESVINIMCDCKEAEEEAYKKREEAEERNRRRRVCFKNSNMDSWNFANDDRRNEKLSTAMEKYCENFPTFKKDGRGLLLHGTVGTGKTYYACCIANELIDKGYSVLCSSFRDVVNELQGMWEGKNEYIEALNRYSLLVLDDLGTERDTDFMKEQIFNIIDSRYRSGLPFIITTNLTMEELKKPKDIAYQRIFDRILERCHPIRIDGMSRRRENVRDNYIKTQELLGL